MICPDCGGTGKKFKYFSELPRCYEGPCEGCGGVGQIHCCDGLQDQPEYKQLERKQEEPQCLFGPLLS